MADAPKELAGPTMPFDGDTFGAAVAAMVRDYVDHEIKNLRAEFEMKLEKAYSAISYQGVHEAGAEYVKGQFVTAFGSLWHCNATTRESPGTGSTDWTLCVKRGRNGKDTPGERRTTHSVRGDGGR